ncbi:DNA cytosine methyltransferase [Tardiphaga alba]|uniref:DNA (cytosine-5-)-methyltransferase n=2 Tax=Tardiphaga alba TaxID=340268 RepID=A0ABX8AHG1_9BRAD|nr:DNA cytosine methyltransferase [Tardiphaga alba]
MSLGLERAGMHAAAFCEIEPYARHVLRRHWPSVPCYDDVCALTADRLRSDGIEVNAICGGFPCQDISYAGFGAGLDGARSGLWFEYARLIGELGPDVVIVENVSALLDRGMGAVLGTLSDLGYNAIWDTVTACAVGLSHVRRRVFIVAYANRLNGWTRFRDSFAREYRSLQTLDRFESARARQRARMANPSSLYGGADGLPYGMERNRGIGNAVAPDVAETIGRAIMTALKISAQPTTAISSKDGGPAS